MREDNKQEEAMMNGDNEQHNKMMEYQNANYNGDNVFERNLVSHQGNDEEEEMIANEDEGNVPVEIFEDVGNHIEDLDNADE